MLVLFAISVVCLCAVLWSAVSIARHVLATQRRRQVPRVPQQRQSLVEVFFDDKMQQIREHAVTTRHAAPPPPLASAWDTFSPLQPAVAMAAEPAALFESPLLRKSPQSAAAGASYRADWDYFNKDLGDLTDPYETNQRDRSEAKSGSRRS